MRFSRILFPSILFLCANPAKAVSLITLEFSGEMTAQQAQTFVDAANFWNSAIDGYDLNSDGEGHPATHSLVIRASVTTIDGQGGILGSAGPTGYMYFDNNPDGQPTYALYYATSGIMSFDSADVTDLTANNSFYGVVLHEMAHVLGIGTFWEGNNDVNNTSYSLYLDGSGQYTGANALREWQNEFGQSLATFVPVELGGGDGTADGHWDETDGGFDTGIVSNLTGLDLSHELMTGWSTDQFFISRMTLGALDDLGYEVNYSVAGLVAVPEISSSVFGIAALPLIWRRRRVAAAI